MHSVVSRISKKHRGKIFSLYEIIRLLGSVVGPLLGGLIWDTLDHVVPYLISIFVVISLIPVFLFAVWKLKPYMAEKV
jgi:MFS family permease